MELLFIAVSKTFVPWDLSATYGYAHVPIINSILGSWMAPAGVAVFIVMLVPLIVKRVRTSPIGIGVCTFLILYFPFSKIPIVLGIDFFAERWLYAPSFGLSLCAGYALWKLWQRRPRIAVAVGIIIFTIYSGVLVTRNRIWNNETWLGESMVINAPRSVISYVFLGNNRLKYNRLDEAAELVTVGLQITRNHIPMHHIAAAVALGMGRLDVAEQAVQAAEELSGDELANVILRCTLLAKQHRYQESLDHLKSSRWFSPREYRVRMLLALNLWMLGRHDEAEEFMDWDRYVPSIKLTREEKIKMFETY
jgi:hypothetical protein